jgi:amidase
MRVMILSLALALPGTALAAGRVEAEAARYAARIAARDGVLHSVIALSPRWRADAHAIDAMRGRGGALAGKVMLIKDNVEVADGNPTTAGSLALAGNVARADAPVVARLRGAGALILGKTNLSEWANIRSSASMSGWSAVAGLVANPHDPRRTACGSSSGSGAAVAAGLAWAAIGTETDGSIVCPSSVNGVVGLKPTTGLVSRRGIVPISHSQDTPGPMATSVRDAATILTAIAGSDPGDAATVGADAHRVDYGAALTGSLQGVRIGAINDAAGRLSGVQAAYARALSQLRAAGAEVVVIAGPKRPEGIGAAELTVLLTELKVDLNAYLATTPPGVTSRDLAALIAFNRANAAREMPFFGQELFEQAQATKGYDDPAYRKALALSRDGARAALRDAMTAARVTILVAPTMGPAWLSDPIYGDQYDGPSASGLPAMAGFPHLTVPMAKVAGLPVGLSFVADQWRDADVLRAGDAFERVRGPWIGVTR